LFKLKSQAPPVFWTPYNGGHWYTTDSALTDQVLRDNLRFSSRTLLVPVENNPPLGRGFSPIHLDPPEHGIYRKLMQAALSRKTVVDMMPGVRAVAIELIESLKPKRRLSIFIEEWLARIPDFQVSRKTPPIFAPGVTASYDRLMLEWPVGHT